MFVNQTRSGMSKVIKLEKEEYMMRKESQAVGLLCFVGERNRMESVWFREPGSSSYDYARMPQLRIMGWEEKRAREPWWFPTFGLVPTTLVGKRSRRRRKKL